MSSIDQLERRDAFKVAARPLSEYPAGRGRPTESVDLPDQARAAPDPGLNCLNGHPVPARATR